MKVNKIVIIVLLALATLATTIYLLTEPVGHEQVQSDRPSPLMEVFDSLHTPLSEPDMEKGGLESKPIKGNV